MLREVLETHIKSNWWMADEYRDPKTTTERKKELEDILIGVLLGNTGTGTKNLDRDMILPIMRNRLRFMPKI